jgi:hypothetical protein
MSEKLNPSSAEQGKKATVVEINPSRLQTTVDAMKKLGAMRIEIPDSLKKKAKGAVLASTLAVSSAFMLGNPDKAFAQTQGDAPKVEQGQKMFNANELPDGSQAVKDFQAYRLSHPEIDKIINENVKAGKGAVVPANMIPQGFVDSVTKTQTEQNQQPNRVIEQPTQPVQTPQPPKNEGFPWMPLAVGGTLLAVGARQFNKKVSNPHKEKRAKETNPRSKQGERPDFELFERLNSVKMSFGTTKPTLENWIKAVKKDLEGSMSIDAGERMKVLLAGGIDIFDDKLLKAKWMYNSAWTEDWTIPPAPEVTATTPETNPYTRIELPSPTKELLEPGDKAAFVTAGMTDAGIARMEKLTRQEFEWEATSPTNGSWSAQFQAFPKKVNGDRDLDSMSATMRAIQSFTALEKTVILKMLENVIDLKIHD